MRNSQPPVGAPGGFYMPLPSHRQQGNSSVLFMSDNTHAKKGAEIGVKGAIKLAATC